MKIKFNDNTYDLTMDPYLSGTRLLVNIQKGEHTYDDVVADTEHPERITILNDEEKIVGVYTGFTSRIALVVLEYIQVEFENTDLISQLNTIMEQVSTQEAAIADLAEVAETTNDQVTTQETAIADLAEEAEQANDTNDTQDAAIADLADIVNSITPEEG